MSSSEGSPSRWSTTGAVAYRRQRYATTQTPLGGEIGNSNGSEQGDQMERPIASQNCLAAAIEFQGWQTAGLVEVLQCRVPVLHDASDVADGVILLRPVADPDDFWFVSNYLSHLLTNSFLLPNMIFACLLIKLSIDLGTFQLKSPTKL